MHPLIVASIVNSLANDRIAAAEAHRAARPPRTSARRRVLRRRTS